LNRDHLIGAVRARLKRYPAPFDSHYGVVPLPPCEEIIPMKQAEPAHREALSAIGRADALAKAAPDHFLLSRILVRQEAVTSSAIEGTHSTLDALLESEADPEDDGDDDETEQVKSYALTLERHIANVERNGYDAFSVALLRDLQRDVVKDDKKHKATPGEIRKHVVYIGTGHISRSAYNPAPPADIHDSLKAQIAYLHCDGLQQLHQSIIVRMAIAHAHFEAIHPFPDGNGRVGRLLLPLMLAADNHTPLYIASYLADRRADYVGGLKEAQQRLNFEPLIEAFSHAIVASVAAAETAHEELTALQTRWRALRKWRQSSGAERALTLLPKRPVVTRKSLASSLRVSEHSAGDAIALLAEFGVLKERTGHRRNRIFVAPDVLKIFRGDRAQEDD
jgi:Fic family protein